ncbi:MULTISPECIES: hypothetical protein [unclassified Flavobacterium]|uniref:hypothetical protein n=1 Tax=unclassified Flavobacterium TaxID=196869 RepID=UPI0010DCA472|nr:MULTISPECIES: hypothetical protein [unclassified Flavobacterium]TDX14328.1 hypothetical protein EDB96_1062 [Flavobacterium sp. S87F.05.LMB.W.Kidney.N]BDU24944.1 hypothetical protein FLGSB24_16880 [Flavobacterium sp. GSB-24]
MNLENLNVVELNRDQSISIEGGGWPEWFATQIVDHWDEIKKGISDGFKAGSK